MRLETSAVRLRRNLRVVDVVLEKRAFTLCFNLANYQSLVLVQNANQSNFGTISFTAFDICNIDFLQAKILNSAGDETPGGGISNRLNSLC